MKAAMYCRRSQDREDRQVLSIEEQRDENKLRLSMSGDKSVGTYEENKSAKTPGIRTEFNRLLADIRSGKVEVVYCWKLNRLARNPEDGGKIHQLLLMGLLKAIVTNDKTYLPTDNVMQMYVELGMATQYSIDLSKDVKRGMMHKVKMGWKPGVSPVGWRPDYDGLKGQRVISKDEDRFNTVRRCWDLLLERRMTVPDILKIATEEWGLTRLAARGKPPVPICKSAMYKIFTNSFYCGEIVWNGEVFEGKHEPMITRAEFDLAQEILGRKGKSRLKTNKNFYSGLIRCGECGSMIVMELKRKLVKSQDRIKEYRYFRCSKHVKNCCCTQTCRLTTEELEVQLTKVVEAVELPDALIEWSLEQLKLSQEDTKKDESRGLEGLQEKYRSILEKRSNLIDRQLVTETRLPEDIYQQKLQELSNEVQRLQSQIQDFEAHSSQWGLDIAKAVSFTEKLRERFSTGTDEKKLEILQRLGQTIELRDGMLTFALQKPYQALSDGRKKLEDALGSVEPLQCGLQSVRKEVLDIMSSLWWARVELNRRPQVYKS